MPAFRIPLLPPDIEPAVLSSFTRELHADAASPDRQQAGFHKALKPLFPDHALLALSSGTAALHLGLRLLGVGEGDYVLCPTFTFAATVNAILYQHASPVFIDSEELSWNMSPELLQQAITSLRRQDKKIAAIIVVHAYGTPASMDAITEIAGEYKIPILEDAAPALGAFYGERMAGTIGELGAYSFNYNKVITTAGGGLLVSREEELIRQADYLANQARAQAPYYFHETWGYNYRMSGMAAQLGTIQLGLLQEKLHRKKEIFSIYRHQLEGCAGIRFQELPAMMKPNYWLSSFLMKDEAGKLEAYRQLQAAAIECRMLWRPLHLQPAYRDFPAYLNGVSEMLFSKGLSLPSACSLSEDEQAEVIARLKKIIISG